MVIMRIYVKAPDGKVHAYVAEAHRSTSRGKRLIETVYADHCGGGFDGAHYELKLRTAVAELPHQDKIRYHRTPSGDSFAGWTGQMPTPPIAMHIFKMWCVGTTYTICTGEDFAAGCLQGRP